MQKTMASETADGIKVHCRFTRLQVVDALIEHPRNPNGHPEDQLRILANVIRETGWRQPVTISDRSGYIIKGHGRLQAAKLGGLTEVPVEVQHYESEQEEMADLIADNRLAEFAEPENTNVAEILKELQSTSEAFVGLTGYEIGDINLLLATEEDVSDEKIGVVEVPEMEAGALARRYLIPPFSLLNPNSEIWTKRRNLWQRVFSQAE